VTDVDATAYLDSLGLTCDGPYLAYTAYGVGWFLPTWVQHGVVRVWNRLACRWYGHEYLGVATFEGDVIEDWACYHCNRRDCRGDG